MDKIKLEAFKQAVIEIAKEGARIAVSFFIGYFLDALVAYFAKTQPTGQMMVATALIIKLADGFWHQYNKETKPMKLGQSQGLIPF